jgi:hypothetical protein
MFILHLSLLLTPGIARQSYWSNLGRGLNDLGNGIRFMVGLKFSQLGCATHPFCCPSGTGIVQERTDPWGTEVNARLCNPTYHKSRWHAASEAHGQLYTLHQRQPKSYECMERDCAPDPLLLCSPLPHCTVKILVFTCRGYLAPIKSTLGTSMLPNYMFVTRKGLIWSWHLWQASQL